jgi:hypothetical protein
LGFLVGDDARRRTYGGGEASEDEGVYSVGLGEPADGLGELVASLARVHDGHRDPGRSDGGCGQTLVASGGLQDDQLLGAYPLETTEEFVDALLVVGEHKALAFWQKADIEVPLGDVDAYYGDLSLGRTHHYLASPSSWCRPGLADTGLLMGRAAAPATVRAPPKEWARRPVLSCGLLAKSIWTKEKSVCRARIGRTL